ncbi:MAG TPA: hypothetical protein DIC24_10075, partial [Gammaproteobacteria bacterium]|nr:hypothetical protein [Gammaproteobacteria bacterium]
SAIYYRLQRHRYFGPARSLGVLRQTECSDPDPGWNQNGFYDFADRHRGDDHPGAPEFAYGSQTVLESVDPRGVPEFSSQPPPFSL